MACSCKNGSTTTKVKQVVKKIHQPKPVSKTNKRVSTIRKISYKRPL